MKFTHTFTLFLLILLTNGVSLVFAWTGPTQTPPGGNVSPPINTSASNQVKNGGLGVNSLAVYGSAIISGVSKYLNFGTTAGVTGYGIRDNAGKMEVKDAGGAWGRLATTTSTGSFPQITFSDGTVQTTAASGGAKYQTFNSSGTWTKPTTGTVAFVECWGGGGGASANSGGGGGGYNSRTIALAALSSSVAVTVGGGGTYGYSSGTNGGTTSFGQYVYAYGGGGGGWAQGGGGGGPLSFGGGDPSDWRRVVSNPGRPFFVSSAYSVPYSIDGSSVYTTASCLVGQGDGSYSGNSGCAAQDGYVHGGGGGVVGNGGSSVYGGGGGGGNIYGSHSGGSSAFGGRGGNSGQSGVQPGGGGGTGSSGAAGRCNVVVW